MPIHDQIIAPAARGIFLNHVADFGRDGGVDVIDVARRSDQLLDALGLGEALRDVSAPNPTVTLRDARGGEVLRMDMARLVDEASRAAEISERV